MSAPSSSWTLRGEDDFLGEEKFFDFLGAEDFFARLAASAFGDSTACLKRPSLLEDFDSFFGECFGFDRGCCTLLCFVEAFDLTFVAEAFLLWDDFLDDFFAGTPSGSSPASMSTSPFGFVLRDVLRFGRLLFLPESYTGS